MYRYLGLLILFLYSPIIFYAQNAIPNTHFNVSNGLPSNVIYDLYQDIYGRIWIATDKGLAVYNGRNFKNYTTNDGLADNEIYFFQPDNNGRLWFATANGKLSYFKNGKFYNEQTDTLLRIPKTSGHVIYISLGEDSTLTFNFSNKAYFVCIKNRTKTIWATQHFSIDSSWGRNIFINKRASNRIEFLQEKGKVVYNAQGQKIVEEGFQKPIRFHKYRQQEYYLYDSLIKNESDHTLGVLPLETRKIEAPFFYRIIKLDTNLFISSNVGFFYKWAKVFFCTTTG